MEVEEQALIDQLGRMWRWPEVELQGPSMTASGNAQTHGFMEVELAGASALLGSRVARRPSPFGLRDCGGASQCGGLEVESQVPLQVLHVESVSEVQVISRKHLEVGLQWERCPHGRAR